MRQSFRPMVALLGLLAAFAFASPAQADLATFSPPSMDFSVAFPAQTTPSAANGVDQWIARSDGFVYLAQRRVFPDGAVYDRTFQADLKDFAKGSGATILEQHAVTWPGPAGALPALRASFQMPAGTHGELLWLIDGNRTFGIMILDTTASARREAMLAVINSFKVLN
jgi:hypothetical protein